MRSVHDLMRLDGRLAVVTGGAGHVGRAVCDALLELGATVVAADVAEQVEHPPVTSRVHHELVNLADEDDTRRLVSDVVERYGRLDVLIHCAAYVGTTSRAGWAVPFAEQTTDAWDDAIRVNLTSAFVLAQAARPALEAAGSGNIVMISSIYGMVGPDMSLYSGTPMANPAAYGVSKGGLLQLARYLATVFAPQVRVNSVTPGGIWRAQPSQFVERYEGRTPLRRMGTEEDLKGAIAYLASDLSRYVTGHNLVVDGGWTAW